MILFRLYFKLKAWIYSTHLFQRCNSLWNLVLVVHHYWTPWQDEGHLTQQQMVASFHHTSHGQTYHMSQLSPDLSGRFSSNHLDSWNIKLLISHCCDWHKSHCYEWQTMVDNLKSGKMGQKFKRYYIQNYFEINSV